MLLKQPIMPENCLKLLNKTMNYRKVLPIVLPQCIALLNELCQSAVELLPSAEMLHTIIKNYEVEYLLEKCHKSHLSFSKLPNSLDSLKSVYKCLDSKTVSLKVQLAIYNSKLPYSQYI